MSLTLDGFQEILDTCEKYAEHNVTFSTKDNPNKCKTKHLIGPNFVGTNFRWPKIFLGPNFRHLLKISSIRADKVWTDKVYGFFKEGKTTEKYDPVGGNCHGFNMLDMLDYYL